MVGYEGFDMAKGIYNRTAEAKRKNRLSKLGHPVSLTTRIKISNSLRGHFVSAQTREKIRKANIGRHHTLSTRLRISKNSSGPLGNRWAGGITAGNKLIREGIQIRLWRESVFARDNWTCQKCKIRGQHLHAHHIKPFSRFPEFRFDINNGITLCKKCHQITHKIIRRNSA